VTEDNQNGRVYLYHESTLSSCCTLYRQLIHVSVHVQGKRVDG